MVIASLLAGSAEARIGETKAECIMRYGQPTERIKGSQFCGFKNGRLHIDIEFDGEGKAVKVWYHKEGHPKLKMREAIALRNFNGKSRVWKKASRQQIWPLFEGYI